MYNFYSFLLKMYWVAAESDFSLRDLVHIGEESL